MLLCAFLLLLMAYQITGDVLHEYLGMAMFAAVLVHNILNRKWYAAIFKGKYKAYRVLMTAVNIILLLSFVLTAISGMAMSGYAVPFMYGALKTSLARIMHLGMSYWSFALMGLHLGLHMPGMTAEVKKNKKISIALFLLFAIASGIGLYFIISKKIVEYLLFQTHFAFLDYDRSAISVFLENISMLLFFSFIGNCSAILCQRKIKADRSNLLLILSILLAILIGVMPSLHVSKKDNFQFDSSSSSFENDIYSSKGDMSNKDIDDGFILLEGGVFEMGSPESENWRIDDEEKHSVAISSFYISPYEATQEEYFKLAGSNPSYFKGDILPVENVSWIDAIHFANQKSANAGLEPSYIVNNDNVIWNMEANGYRLPTEAEWEYACRAGSNTPFNTEKSIDATHANFYGHYPYEIEENYFNDSVLEARPGVYRQKTVDVGSFKPNKWGLYDMHGNVNEWCWDFYGEYEIGFSANPTGPKEGSRHIYRGGGWNDFAKNMRSAYRAAGQDDMRSHNIGIRLVRNAGKDRKGETAALIHKNNDAKSDKILVAYFSWSGNTRGIAKEIQRQLKADIFEISPVNEYSSSYNKVLMQAQEDQHKNARPMLKGKIDNFDEYDTIILGYPNWWASIPAPVATFLEEYDFSARKIYPFCSHGGGRFGQSLTAIAKLAPNSDIKEGLSIHYSGGSSLQKDVSAWLKSSSLL